MDTIEIIKNIIHSNIEVKNIYLHYFPTPKGIEDRVKFGTIERQQFNNAIQIKEAAKISFWESLMLSFFNREHFSEDILHQMLNHHTRRDKFPVGREEVLDGYLEQYRDLNDNVAINSKVQMNDGKIKHLVLLDFHIPATPLNQKVVESVLYSFNLSNGYLLKSGKSYHYVSNFVVSKIRLNQILNRSLFYSPIIDKYWVAHQLMDKSCSIRITRKDDILPILIKKI
jgi:hypothetical protein